MKKFIITFKYGIHYGEDGETLKMSTIAELSYDEICDECIEKMCILALKKKYDKDIVIHVWFKQVVRIKQIK